MFFFITDFLFIILPLLFFKSTLLLFQSSLLFFISSLYFFVCGMQLSRSYCGRLFLSFRTLGFFFFRSFFFLNLFFWLLSGLFPLSFTLFWIVVISIIFIIFLTPEFRYESFFIFVWTVFIIFVTSVLILFCLSMNSFECSTPIVIPSEY